MPRYAQGRSNANGTSQDNLPPPPYVDAPNLVPYHTHLESERTRLQRPDRRGNMNINYGSFNQPPPTRGAWIENNSGAGQQPQPLNEPGIRAPNKASSPTRFEKLSYAVICLVMGYLFNNLWNSASWTLEENDHDRARRIWRREEADHERVRLRMLEEKAAWENEKIIRDAERERWERVEREGRAGIMWEHVHPSDKCLRYGTKEYTGMLTHVPFGFDAMQECMKKPALINGKERFPVRCEDPGTCGEVVGHWEVDNEAMCSPGWGWIYDKGCDGNHYGKRRFEGQLINLHPWDEWYVLCPTTPVDIRGHHFDGPDSCADWGGKGIWGIWFLEDRECR